MSSKFKISFMINKFEKKTRATFHKIHLKQISNKSSFSKVATLYNLKNLKLSKDYFKNKVCADLGCGSTGAGAYNLFQLGVEFVHLLDLDKSIEVPLKKKLKKFSKKIKVHIGSLEKTSFPDNYFDFILCQGVIHHARNPKQCLREIKRILKPKGKCLLLVNGKGGLITNFVDNVLRPQYKKNKEIKKFVDSVIFNKLSTHKKFYMKNSSKDSKKIINFLNKYIDEDLFLTMQDRVLAPKYESFDYEKLLSFLNKIGFINIYRISKRVKFKNLRQLLSPFYYFYDHSISKALYGDGNITLMITKK